MKNYNYIVQIFYGDGAINTTLTNTIENSNKFLLESTNLSSLSTDDDKFSSLSTSAMLARGEVPESHKRIADNYMVIQKVFGIPVVRPRLSNEEKALLSKYDFNLLEFSTIKQINEELSFLKKWSMSLDNNLKADSNRLLEIRAKELKFIDASYYATISNEIYKGYVALAHYFEEISKFKN